MAVFPLFVDLKDKKCVVVGGGNVAQRKLESLLYFGVEAIVVSPEVTSVIWELGQEGRISVIRRGYSEGDLEQAFMVIAATSDREVNERVYNDAINLGVFVNVADNPSKCTFVFPSIIKREELVVGISTSGKFPALSKKIREKIEKVLPGICGDALEVLGEYRGRAESEIRDARARRVMLNRMADEVLLSGSVYIKEQLKLRLENIFGEYADEKGN